MRYMGGKSKIAKELSAVILANTKSRKFYLEPFIGGGSVFPHLAPHFEWAVAGDAHEDLVMMWNALIFDGWVPPDTITEEQYAELKESEPSALRALAGFGGSFGSKWFGGYARGGKRANGEPRDHQAESVRAAVRIATAARKANAGRFRNWSYSDWKPVAGTVVYCDPPYADTQGYATGSFDSAAFWAKMDEWVSLGCEVFVSEYAAPEHWHEVWSKQHRMSVTDVKNRKLTTERLFTRLELT